MTGRVFVSAEPIRAHILELLSIGMGPTMIAAYSGVALSVVQQTRKGVYATMESRNAQALLAVDHRPCAAQSIVLSVGAVRRLRALSGIGWSFRHVGERLGVTGWALGQLAHRPTVTYARWRQVRDTYEEWSGTPGPSLVAIRHARCQRWLLPLDFEGFDIDDPRVTPLSWRPELVKGSMPRRTRSVIHAEAAARRERAVSLSRAGLTHVQIAEAMGLHERQVCRDLATARSSGDQAVAS